MKRSGWAVAMALGLVSLPAWAINAGYTDSTIDPRVVAVNERKYLGAPVDRSVEFIDAEGRRFTIDEMLDRPLILLFSYYTCDGLCWTINKRLAWLIREMKGRKIGEDYRVLTLSFDRNDTAETLHAFADGVGASPYMRPGWRHAIFADPEAIEPFTASLGIRYFWSYRDNVFLHPNAFLFISPEGRVVRYLYGEQVRPRDVELALIDADWDKVSTAGRVIDILAGVCFSYNFKEGRYTINYPLFIGVASLLSGIAVVVFSFLITRRRLRRMGHV